MLMDRPRAEGQLLSPLCHLTAKQPMRSRVVLVVFISQAQHCVMEGKFSASRSWGLAARGHRVKWLSSADGEQNSDGGIT